MHVGEELDEVDDDADEEEGSMIAVAVGANVTPVGNRDEHDGDI